MKEAQSSEPNCRGDDKGNCLQYQYPAVKIPETDNNCPLDVTLTLDDTAIHGKVGGTSFSQRFPSRLTKRVWENGAYFIFQQINQGSGRAESVVDEIRIDYTALATTKGLDMRKDPPDKDRYPDRVIVRAKKLSEVHLSDTADEIIGNCLGDWAIRNVSRSLDTMSGVLDAAGFSSSRFYVSEWGAQSDVVASAKRNDLITCMASALATAKVAMAIYAHPRTAAAAFHPIMQNSRVSRTEKLAIPVWGDQSVFFMADLKQYQTTPVSEALILFREFASESTLVPGQSDVPAGAQVLSAVDKEGPKYFVVNSAVQGFRFPAAISKRRTLSAPTSESISMKYGSFGDRSGDVEGIVPHDFRDAKIPPYSVNLLR